MPFGEELWYPSVLLKEHHWIASEFEPISNGVLLLFPVAMQYQVSQAVNRAKLINVAACDPESLIEGTFLCAIKRFLQGLFELSGSKKFHMHAMKATLVIPSPLVQVHSVPILIL